MPCESAWSPPERQGSDAIPLRATNHAPLLTTAPLQRLLMAEAGLDLKDLVMMARWGNYAPRLAEVAKIPITGRKSGAILRDRKERNADDSRAKTTRYISILLLKVILVAYSEVLVDKEQLLIKLLAISSMPFSNLCVKHLIHL